MKRSIRKRSAGVDIRFQRVQAESAQGIRQVPRLPVALAVHTTTARRAKLRSVTGRSSPGSASSRPGRLQCPARGKDAALAAHQGAQGAAVGGEPVLQLHPVAGIAPVAGEEKTFEGLYSQT